MGTMAAMIDRDTPSASPDPPGVGAKYIRKMRASWSSRTYPRVEAWIPRNRMQKKAIIERENRKVRLKRNTHTKLVLPQRANRRMSS